MSKVAPRTEHLFRAALSGIRQHPETWDQEHWVYTPLDRRERGEPVPACGTTYCIGGWMMLHDGFRHSRDNFGRNIWWKDVDDVNKIVIKDPYTEHLWSLVEEAYGTDTLDIYGTMFAPNIHTLRQLEGRIGLDLDIDLDAPCPCTSEADLCDRDNCPCGIHAPIVPAKLLVSEVEPGAINYDMMEIIESFVSKCAAVGDNITMDQVMADAALMSAFRAMYTAGKRQRVNPSRQEFLDSDDYRRAVVRANDAEHHLNEAQHALKVSETTNGELRAEIEEFRAWKAAWQQANPAYSGRISTQSGGRDAITVIKRLQGQIDDMKAAGEDVKGLKKELATLRRRFREAELANERLKAVNAGFAQHTSRLDEQTRQAILGQARTEVTSYLNEALRKFTKEKVNG